MSAARSPGVLVPIEPDNGSIVRSVQANEPAFGGAIRSSHGGEAGD